MASFLKLSQHCELLHELINRKDDLPKGGGGGFSEALQRLTQPHLPTGLSSVVKATKSAALSIDSPGSDDDSSIPSKTMDAMMAVR